MTKEELQVKAVETALEWTKQIITIATAIIVLSGSFLKDFLEHPLTHQSLLVWSWGLLCLSIISGIMFLGSLCSLLHQGKPKRLSIYKAQPRITGLIHFLSFVAAIILFVIFSSINLNNEDVNKAVGVTPTRSACSRTPL